MRLLPPAPRPLLLLAAGAGMSALLALPTPAPAHETVSVRLAGVSSRIAANPLDAGLFLERAELNREAGNARAALADLDRASRLAPGLAGLPQARAAAWLDLGRPDAALRALGRPASTAEPGVAEGALRARALAACGRKAAAVAAWSRAIARSEAPDPEFYLERARLQAALGATDSALAGLAEGARRLGSVVFEEEGLSIEARSGRIGPALARVERLLAERPSQPAWRVRRAELLEMAGRRLESLAAFTEAWEVIRSLPAARRGAPDMRSLAARCSAALDRGEAAR